MELIFEFVEPIALIADVHGNIHVLDAVLADIQRREIASIITSSFQHKPVVEIS